MRDGADFEVEEEVRRTRRLPRQTWPAVLRTPSSKSGNITLTLATSRLLLTSLWLTRSQDHYKPSTKYPCSCLK